MVPRENKNNAYAKFGGGGGQTKSIMVFPKWPIAFPVVSRNMDSTRFPAIEA